MTLSPACFYDSLADFSFIVLFPIFNIDDVSTCGFFEFVSNRLLLKKSADLDTEEAQIRAGTHPSLLSELNAIEERRKSKLGVVAARKSYHRESINSTFKATLKAAHDQYTVSLSSRASWFLFFFMLILVLFFFVIAETNRKGKSQPERRWWTLCRTESTG